MPINLVSAVPQKPNTLNVSFSEAFIENDNLFETSHYVFRTRYGKIVPLRAKLIDVISTQIVRVTLTDAMLNEGKYSLTVNKVVGSDGIAIDDGTNSVNFEGVGDSGKCFDLRRRIPKREEIWRTEYGTQNHAILCATGELLETIGGDTVDSQINEAARAMTLRAAEGEDLSIIGQNYGVTRPVLLAFDDETYRDFIPILAAKRKTALNIFYEALTLLLGDRSTLARPWKIYNVEVNTFVLEVPEEIFYGIGVGDLPSATYLHENADSGFAQGSIQTNLGYGDGQALTFNDGTNPLRKFELRLSLSSLAGGSIWVPLSSSFTASDVRESVATSIEKWNHPKGQLFVPTNGAAINETETITIDDGVNPAVTFEWDSNASVVETATLRAINYTAGMTQAQVRDAMVTAINGAPSLDITLEVLTAEATKFSLFNDVAGVAGNVAITHTTTAAGFAAYGMSGGDAGSFKISVNTSSDDTLTVIHEDQNASGNQAIVNTTSFTVSGMAGGGTYLGDYFLASEAVSGGTIDGHIIILFQAIAVEQIVDPIKAAGIEYTVEIIT